MGIVKIKKSLTAAELRHRAEVQLEFDAPEADFSRSSDETQRLLHELQVHQIELEMQNAELRKTRDEVETSLNKYTDLYDFAPVGYFTLDCDGVIRAVNLTGASLLRIERTRLFGRHFEQIVSDVHRPIFTEYIRKATESHARETCEVELLKEGRNPFFVQIKAVIAPSRQECRLAVIDITDHRKDQDAINEKQREIEELNRTLEDRISQAVDDLRMKDQLLILQDRRAVLGDMINNIAHQWRQPLNVLGLYVQDLAHAYETAEFNKKYLDTCVGKSMQLIMHMSQTIEDFMDFCRPDREEKTFRVDRVVEKTILLFKDYLKIQNISISFNVEGEPEIKGYPNEYAHVLLNILMNARDELVGHNVADARISIHAFDEEGTSVVTIADNAGGIPDEIMGSLFDPYISTKEPEKGTGVGLFMSKTIIEKNMNGRLTVHNSTEGAVFRIEV
jgi:signal transduction histidine kinase